MQISHTKSLRTQKETRCEMLNAAYVSDFGVEKTVLGLFKAPCKNIHSDKDVPAP